MHAGADDYTKQKQNLRDRPRRVILNNDGGDATKPDVSELAQPEDFLDVRTRPLTGSHVDVISYCTSRGFGMFTHNSQVGQPVTTQASDSGHSVIAALIEKGTDPLATMVEYGHANGMEVFWSMRMNDTHDASRPAMFEGNRFKEANPECLLSTPSDRPRHGQWSAVDYGQAKVRTMACAFVEEICRGYDVDGIELDFFRHPVFFKEAAAGRPVDEEARDGMTDLIRRIAATAEEHGRRRGRPFLIAVRTPDDVDYANSIGLAIEQWMREGLIDIFIPSAYIRLNDWRSSVELGHRYGGHVYPGLSESRVGGGHHADPLRSSDECYRARAHNAWEAGADGIYLFNLFDPQREIWRQIGDPSVLAAHDKLYFASVRGVGRVAGGAYPHAHFIRVPTVNPDAPLPIEPDGRRAVRIEMAEHPTPRPEAHRPAFTLFLQMIPDDETDEALAVAFNGRALAGAQATPRGLAFELDPQSVRQGWNTVEIHYRGERTDLHVADVMVSVDHSGTIMADTSYLERTRARM